MSNPQLPDERRGLLCGLLASILWGTVFVAARFLIDRRGLEPFYAAALRFSGGAAALSLYLAATRRGAALRKGLRDWPRFLPLGATGIFGLGALVMLSARYTDSIISSLIVNANAIFIAALAPLVGERVGFARAAGVVLGLVGCALVVVGDFDLTGAFRGRTADLWGGLLAGGAALSFAVYTVLGKSASRKYGGIEATAAGMVWGSVLLWAAALLWGRPSGLDVPEALTLAYLAVLPTAAGFALWYLGAALADAGALGPMQYVAPIVSTVLGWWLLGEKVGVAFFVGAALVAVGLHLATRPLEPAQDASQARTTGEGGDAE